MSEQYREYTGIEAGHIDGITEESEAEKALEAELEAEEAEATDTPGEPPAEAFEDVEGVVASGADVIGEENMPAEDEDEGEQ